MPSGIYKHKPLSEEWRRKISESKRGKRKPPFSEEWRRKISESAKARGAKPPSSLGRKWTESQREKMVKAMTGRVFSLEHRQRISESKKGHSAVSEEGKRSRSIALKGKKKSLDFRLKISGAKNYRWKGGITPLRGQIRHCFEYCEWRKSILKRDDWTCQKCGLRGGDMEVDHYPKTFADIFHKNKIKSLKEAKDCEEFWNLNNGRTLHKKCHRPNIKQ